MFTSTLKKKHAVGCYPYLLSVFNYSIFHLTKVYENFGEEVHGKRNVEKHSARLRYVSLDMAGLDPNSDGETSSAYVIVGNLFGKLPLRTPTKGGKLMVEN